MACPNGEFPQSRPGLKTEGFRKDFVSYGLVPRVLLGSLTEVPKFNYLSHLTITDPMKSVLIASSDSI